MALQFAGAFGCEVTAFSTSPEKEEDIRELGANHFICSCDTEKMESMARSMDLIISLTLGDIDWDSYLRLLRPNGKLCIIGIPPGAARISALPVISGQLTVCGSTIGSRSDIREMLEFAARHEVKAQVEVMPMTKVNEGIARLRGNKARYRIVLEN